MKNAVTLLLAAGILAGCQERTPEPSEDTATLHTRFHGKYQLLSAVADVAVDLNQDGIRSANLVEEIPNLKSSDVLLLIRENSGVKLFEQAWPQPNVTRDWRYNHPDSLTVQGYANQLVGHHFKFDKSVTNLLVEPDAAAIVKDDRFPIPEIAAIENGDQLRIVVRRAVYTRQGWQVVRITTVYKRYTTTT